jgi:hypothetical protein
MDFLFTWVCSAQAGDGGPGCGVWRQLAAAVMHRPAYDAIAMHIVDVVTLTTCIAALLLDLLLRMLCVAAASWIMRVWVAWCLPAWLH